MTDAANRPIVLIVEDETLLRRLTSEEFEEAGYAVIEAEDGPSAVDTLTSSSRASARARRRVSFTSASRTYR